MAARYGSGADLARALGITRQAVSKAEQSGRISRSANGQFDLDAAAIQYRLHTDPEQQLRSLQQRGAEVTVLDRPGPSAAAFDLAARAAHAAAQSTAGLPALPDIPGMDAAGRLMVAKARREQAEAELAEIELSKAHGSLLDAGDVKRATFALARSVRDALLAVPDRLAAQLAAEADAAVCRRMLADELRQVLAQLTVLPAEEPPA
jgi:phage terminase Nu1 subunit (DNA packaging protein)